MVFEEGLWGDQYVKPIQRVWCDSMIMDANVISDVMMLKRVTKQKSQSKQTTEKTNVLVSNVSGGLCFDFREGKK